MSIARAVFNFRSTGEYSNDNSPPFLVSRFRPGFLGYDSDSVTAEEKIYMNQRLSNIEEDQAKEDDIRVNSSSTQGTRQLDFSQESCCSMTRKCQ